MKLLTELKERREKITAAIEEKRQARKAIQDEVNALWSEADELDVAVAAIEASNATALNEEQGDTWTPTRTDAEITVADLSRLETKATAQELGQAGVEVETPPDHEPNAITFDSTVGTGEQLAEGMEQPTSVLNDPELIAAVDRANASIAQDEPRVEGDPALMFGAGMVADAERHQRETSLAERLAAIWKPKEDA